MSARNSRFGAFSSRSGRGKAAGAVIACAVMFLAGCGGSGGTAADAGAPVIRGDVVAAGYPVTFYSNGGTGAGMVQNPPAMPGVAVALTLNTYTRAGYDFVRWNTAANGSGTNYSNGKVVTFTSGMLFYAVWVAVVAPGVPNKPTVAAGIGKVTATVAAGTKGGVPKFYTVTAYNSGSAAAGTCTVTGVSGSCDVTGLTGGATYTVKATATNNGGTSNANAALKTVTLLGAPAAPAKPTVVAGTDKVTVTMAAATTGDTPASYTVTAYKSDSTAAGTCTVTGVSGSCDVTGLAPGTAYTVKATATNAAGTSVASDETATVTQAMAPSQPGIGAVSSIAPTTATVTFTAPFDGGSPITTYTATSSPAGGTGTASQAGTMNVTGLTAGTYTFTVTATNAKGTSIASPVSASLTTYGVGSTGPGGGKVFYFSSTGFTSTGSACGASCHYLEVNTKLFKIDQFCNLDKKSIGGTFGTDIGTGFSNTKLMTDPSNANYCASGAGVSARAASGGYSDWFLPSKSELMEITTSDYGQTPGTGFWSSSQVDAKLAWFVYGKGISPLAAGKSDGFSPVLQVRAF
jgi:hypothetical protein